jgi:hypothetical protein
MHGRDGNVYIILVGKLDGKKPLKRPRHRWDDSIRMDLRKIVWEGMEYVSG